MFAHEEPDQASHLLGTSHASHRDLGPHLVELGTALRVCIGAQCSVCLHHRRCDRIHQDACCGELLAQTLCHADHAGLGGAIGSGVRVAFLARRGGDVDDAAVLPFQHVGDDGTAEVERRLQVQVQHHVPLLVADLPHRHHWNQAAADVVHKNVDAAEVKETCRCCSDAIGGIGCRTLQRQHVDAACSHLRGRGAKPLLVHVKQRDGGAATTQELRGGASDAGARTGDEGHAAVQAQFRQVALCVRLLAVCVVDAKCLHV